jgi:site-specific recombinase XerD
MPLEVASITAEHIETFMADQLERLRPASARAGYAILRQFFACAASPGEREIETSPMAHMKPPKIPDNLVPVLSEEELRALLRTVDHDTDYFGRRDAALIRLFIDTGARLSEVSGLLMAGVSLEAQTVTFLGKGGSERINPIGTKTVRALDRYLRIRAGHRDSFHEQLWLGRSGPMSPYGVAEAVKRRAYDPAGYHRSGRRSSNRHPPRSPRGRRVIWAVVLDPQLGTGARVLALLMTAVVWWRTSRLEATEAQR